jgi:hypothetical protein
MLPNTSVRMSTEQYDLIQAIGKYGKAMEDRGRDESDQDADDQCDKLGWEVVDKLDRVFKRRRWSLYFSLTALLISVLALAKAVNALIEQNQTLMHAEFERLLREPVKGVPHGQTQH